MPNILPGEPIPGHRTGGDPGGSWSFDFSGLSPLFNALMSRYGQAMDYQLQDMSHMPERNARAYAEWLQKRGDERKARYFEMAQSAEQQKFNEQQTLLAEKLAREAALKADMEKRASLMASVGRSQALQAQYGGPTPFNPAASVADFYEYGAGNPQGRGGGGSTGREGGDEAMGRCIADPRAPGCPGDPLLKGYGV